MTIEMYLSTIFQVAAAIAFTALCAAVVVVSIFYSYKMAYGLIVRFEKNISRLKNHRLFKMDRSAIRVVKEERKKVKAG
jgi:hypothetical protein